MLSWTIAVVGCTTAVETEPPLLSRPTGQIVPLSPPSPEDPGRVALGKRLFHDPLLSADGTVSCASCHNLSAGGVDHLPTSVGIGGHRTAVNSPTVFNAALNVTQFWDGRAKTLEAQISGPILAEGEMGNADWASVVTRLENQPRYAAAFADSYSDGVTPENIAGAIATFERTLITVDAPFDRYLRGDSDAMSEPAKRGWTTFRELGCISCHQGENIGGNMFQGLGVMGDYFTDRGNITEADNGRFNVTGEPDDKHVFKVPSLRNIAETAPYFHDGTQATLPDAIQAMAQYQLGRRVTDDEVTHLVAFLESLSGTVPPEALP